MDLSELVEKLTGIGLSLTSATVDGERVISFTCVPGKFAAGRAALPEAELIAADADPLEEFLTRKEPRT